jgi:hypothetical protein
MESAGLGGAWPRRRRPHVAGGPRSKVGALVLLAGVGVLAGCGGSGPTPEIIYTTLPATPSPATATPATATPVASASAAASVTPVAPTASAPSSDLAPTVGSTTITSSAADGSWTVSFREPVVSGVSDAAVTAMNNSITTRVNSFISAFNGSELPAVAAGDGPSTLTGDFTVALVSPSLLSLRFTIDTYVTGAAHPSREVGSLNFSVGTGTVIQLADTFTSPAAALPVLQTQAHTRLTTLLGADLQWPASVTMADFGKAWVFTTAGLELAWSQGDIAATAAGTPTISIPWSTLAGVIANPGPAAAFIS